METIKMYQVDAFTDKLFTGNPAAVCILDEWLKEDIMQSIAAENNLAETAFVVRRSDYFDIRWFTPTVEVDLCGHATLASAYVLFNCLHYDQLEIIFHSKSGELKVYRDNEMLFLDFPTDTLTTNYDMDVIKECIGLMPEEVHKGKSDFLAVLKRESDILNIAPDFLKIAQLPARGLIVTARGEEVDFVSRFFAPQCGINEDPVTGSAHTTLTPFWARKFGKNNLTARQLSKRGGVLTCKYMGNRVHIGGSARLFMMGELYLPDMQ